MEDNLPRKGGQKGNLNAVKHGSFIQLMTRRLDNRTRLAKVLNGLRSELVSDLGGDPSCAQKILVDRVSHKVAAAYHMELALREGKMHLLEKYTTLTNSLRADLQSLGLERRQKDYKGYLDEIRSSSIGGENGVK